MNRRRSLRPSTLNCSYSVVVAKLTVVRLPKEFGFNRLSWTRTTRVVVLGHSYSERYAKDGCVKHCELNFRC